MVERLAWTPCPPLGEQGFQIVQSRQGVEHRALISPDVATCAACLHELFDPTDRRYRYPFINCTKCGPRFTITRAVPYDRAMTTMAGFPLCDACRREYDDPADRRFHAQPNACLADNGRPYDESVIGVALDGTGYGGDGTIWGGEFLLGSIREGFACRAHLAYLPLPGGEAAIRQPWRLAIAQLIAIYGEERTIALPLALVRRAGERPIRQIARLLEHRLNTPMSSSAGRLFDAVAALVGLPGAWHIDYEGQAAIELELASQDLGNRSCPFRLHPHGDLWVVETQQLIAAVVDDVSAALSVGEIGAVFHRTMAAIVVDACVQIRQEQGIAAVALSGGTFRNVLLLRQAVYALTQQGFTVYQHRQVPTNDGGLCLGQVVLADGLLRKREC